LKLKHDSIGILAMANSGKNSNSSQFYFTLAPAPQCDGNYTIFGKCVEGLDVLKKMEAVGTKDGNPTTEVIIVDCGTF